nr:MAG TPA: hypothetical protein [Microviridae sp.]
MGTKEKSIIESIIKWGGWFIAALQSILDIKGKKNGNKRKKYN